MLHVACFHCRFGEIQGFGVEDLKLENTVSGGMAAWVWLPSALNVTPDPPSVAFEKASKYKSVARSAWLQRELNEVNQLSAGRGRSLLFYPILSYKTGICAGTFFSCRQRVGFSPRDQKVTNEYLRAASSSTCTWCCNALQ